MKLYSDKPDGSLLEEDVPPEALLWLSRHNAKSVNWPATAASYIEAACQQELHGTPTVAGGHIPLEGIDPDHFAMAIMSIFSDVDSIDPLDAITFEQSGRVLLYIDGIQYTAPESTTIPSQIAELIGKALDRNVPDPMGPGLPE